MTPDAPNPFVLFKMAYSLELNSTKQIVFSSEKTCILKNIIVSNLTASPIMFSCYLTPFETEEKVNIVLNYSVQKTDALPFFNGMIINPNDTLWAYTDYSNNMANIFISYEELQN